ncbi:MAG: 2,5-diketo-D-gluconic acid reductase [Crocinitomicaceae bacterium]|nr:2,5-diketo-D-gluconic acid reductase [Crocinitomicaceae bacterium]|tara:strand:+ start:3197 stop:4045 length:849 start_codon:yes stop_codon:yes gene_type:complete
MKTIRLNNGVEMPILGYGVYQVPDYDECKKSVLVALEAGYCSIDTAQAYQNEEAVGDAIKESGIDRKELFITTKLWITDFGYEAAKKAFQVSLEKLQLEYVDLYLLHQPFGDVHGAWKALEELYKEGKIRAIGVSNFYPDRVMDLINFNEIIPMVNQIETNPFYQRNEDHTFLVEEGVVHESWAPFAEGRGEFFNNEVLAGIGEKYGKSVAQVTLRWMIQRDVVVIPKSVTPSRIRENIDVFDFELSQEDMEAIAALDKNESQFFSHRDPATVKWFGTLLNN